MAPHDRRTGGRAFRIPLGARDARRHHGRGAGIRDRDLQGGDAGRADRRTPRWHEPREEAGPRHRARRHHCARRGGSLIGGDDDLPQSQDARMRVQAGDAPGGRPPGRARPRACARTGPEDGRLRRRRRDDADRRVRPGDGVGDPVSSRGARAAAEICDDGRRLSGLRRA